MHKLPRRSFRKSSSGDKFQPAVNWAKLSVAVPFILQISRRKSAIGKERNAKDNLRTQGGRGKGEYALAILSKDHWDNLRETKARLIYISPIKKNSVRF